MKANNLTMPTRETSTRDTARHVWIVNHHAAFPSKDGQGGRHISLAGHLPASGWKATIIAATTTHPSGAQKLHGFRFRKTGDEAGVKYLWVRSISYRGNGARRVLGMASFALMALSPGMCRGLDRPDLIIGSTVHPLAAWAGMRLAARHRVPFVFEVRDVWPDALVELGRLTPNGIGTRIMRRLMHGLANKAQLVMAPLPGVRKYLDEAGMPDKDFVWVPNGVESAQPLSSSSMPERSPFTFMYLGAHGNANALEGILNAFEIFARENPQIDARLRLVGDGPRKVELQNFARKLKAGDRIAFENPVPRAAVLELASEADCMVASLHDHNVYRYGVSPNKIFDYLLAARPIIFATNAELNPVREGDAGAVVEADNSLAIAEAMGAMVRQPRQRLQELGENGRRHVLENYTYETLAKRLAESLDGVMARADKSG